MATESQFEKKLVILGRYHIDIVNQFDADHSVGGFSATLRRIIDEWETLRQKQEVQSQPEPAEIPCS